MKCFSKHNFIKHFCSWDDQYKNLHSLSWFLLGIYFFPRRTFTKFYQFMKKWCFFKFISSDFLTILSVFITGYLYNHKNVEWTWSIIYLFIISTPFSTGYCLSLWTSHKFSVIWQLFITKESSCVSIFVYYIRSVSICKFWFEKPLLVF